MSQITESEAKLRAEIERLKKVAAQAIAAWRYEYPVINAGQFPELAAHLQAQALAKAEVGE